MSLFIEEPKLAKGASPAAKLVAFLAAVLFLTPSCAIATFISTSNLALDDGPDHAASNAVQGSSGERSLQMDVSAPLRERRRVLRDPSIHTYQPNEQLALEHLKRVGKMVVEVAGRSHCVEGAECKAEANTSAALAALAAGQGCKMKAYGSAWGAHNLCERPSPQKPCHFYSFGISNDYSFDTAYAAESGCQGIGMDPTVVHPARLHDRFTFHVVAARMLDEGGPRAYPMVTSAPGLRRWQRHNNISVLKMDCEGCEYSLARDVELEDPSFFSMVDQVALEIHLAKKWAATYKHVLSLGHLMGLMDQAGLLLRDATITSCWGPDEATGCAPGLKEAGWPCGKEMMCQNLLFAK